MVTLVSCKCWKVFESMVIKVLTWSTELMQMEMDLNLPPKEMKVA